MHWDTILTSFITSATVSLITFILGLRAGKNQSDRQSLKDRYRRLAVHFEDIASGIRHGRPREWGDYPVNHRARRFDTPVKQMLSDGSLLDMPSSLVQQMEDVEKDALAYGWRYQQAADVAWNAAKNTVQQQAVVPLKETDCSLTPLSSQQIPRRWIEVSFFELLSDGVEMASKHLSDDPELGVVLVYYSRDRRRCEIRLGPGVVTGNVTDLLRDIWAVSSSVPEFRKVLQDKPSILRRVERLQRKLANRARDPHPFWETLVGAWLDLFRFR